MKNIIGIDIGASKITGVVFDGKQAVKDLTIVTPKNRFEFERNLFKLVDFLSAGQKIGGIGIGCAGRVNPSSGTVRLSENIKFKAEINFVKLFKSKYKVPVKVDNDASCFTRAEMVLGQGKVFKNFLGITLGTGLGGGVVINRKMYRGNNNSGAEFGHIVMDSGFLEKSYFQKARDSKNYKAMGAVVGRLLATAANIFAPSAVILGGGVTEKHGSRFLPLAKKEMKKFLFDQNSEPKILTTKLKNASALGAALLLK